MLKLILKTQHIKIYNGVYIFVMMSLKHWIKLLWMHIYIYIYISQNSYKKINKKRQSSRMFFCQGSVMSLFCTHAGSETILVKKGCLFSLIYSVSPPTLLLPSFSVYDSPLSSHNESLIVYWGCITETSYLNSWLKIWKSSISQVKSPWIVNRIGKIGF